MKVRIYFYTQNINTQIHTKSSQAHINLYIYIKICIYISVIEIKKIVPESDMYF